MRVIHVLPSLIANGSHDLLIFVSNRVFDYLGAEFVMIKEVSLDLLKTFDLAIERFAVKFDASWVLSDEVLESTFATFC